MNTIYKFSLLTFLLLFSINSVFASGGNRNGTGGANQLLIPVGARSIAMGGANIASAVGIDALYWNPAGISRGEHNVDATFSHMTYMADIGVEYGAVAAKVEGLGVIAFNIKALSIGDILITTTQDPDGTGATFSPQMLTAGVSYSKLLTENISVGVTANFITESLGEVDASGMAFDIGVIYQNLADINGLSFGLTIKNLGPEMQYDGPGLLYESSVEDFNRPPQLSKAESAPFELPSQFELGVAYNPVLNDLNNLIISTSFQNNNFSGDEYKVGAEYAYSNSFFVRGGYAFAPDLNDQNYLLGLTAGAGVKYNVEGMNLRFDYAYRDMELFDANHVFAVSVGF